MLARLAAAGGCRDRRVGVRVILHRRGSRIGEIASVVGEDLERGAGVELGLAVAAGAGCGFSLPDECVGIAAGGGETQPRQVMAGHDEADLVGVANVLEGSCGEGRLGVLLQEAGEFDPLVNQVVEMGVRDVGKLARDVERLGGVEGATCLFKRRPELLETWGCEVGGCGGDGEGMGGWTDKAECSGIGLPFGGIAGLRK